MIGPWASCQNVAFAVFAILPFSLFGHYQQPLRAQRKNRIGPATMQAFRSRAILRDGSMGLDYIRREQTATRILAAVFYWLRFAQCFMRDSLILALVRSGILSETHTESEK